MYFSSKEVSPADIIGGSWEEITDCMLAAHGNDYVGVLDKKAGSMKIGVEQLPAHNHRTVNDNVIYNSASGSARFTVAAGSTATLSQAWLSTTYTGGARLRTISLFDVRMEENCLDYLLELM